MRNLGLLALTCLLAVAFTTQVDAGFRVRPVSDRSENGEHDRNNGDRDDRCHHGNHNGNDDNRGHDDNQQNEDDHGNKGHGNNDDNRGDDDNQGNHDGNGDQGDQDTHRNPLLEMIHHFIRKFDRNRDKVLSYREAPKWLKKNFSEVDTNRDGKIDAKELMQLVDRHKQNEGDKERPPRHPRPIDNRPPPRY